ncbi:hypothetical protein, partial [Bacteroides heparinolyticus]|uniref:hypothetical protein n=1 Tax=Prevotella heparinolytica TaxID=28113 RepID=UPI0035A16619
IHGIGKRFPARLVKFMPLFFVLTEMSEAGRNLTDIFLLPYLLSVFIKIYFSLSAPLSEYVLAGVCVAR